MPKSDTKANGIIKSFSESILTDIKLLLQKHTDNIESIYAEMKMCQASRQAYRDGSNSRLDKIEESIEKLTGTVTSLTINVEKVSESTGNLWKIVMVIVTMIAIPYLVAGFDAMLPKIERLFHIVP